MISNHYFDGGNYPIGRGSKIAETIVNVIKKNGGEVVTNAAVKEILVEKDCVKGVLLENGHRIFSHRVISNAGLKNTFNHLLPKSSIRKKRQFKFSVIRLKVFYGSLLSLHRT